MEDPIRVLYVDADRSAAERAASAMVDRGPFEVLGVDTPHDAVDCIRDHDEIHCVVVADGDSLDGIALVSRLAGDRPSLPVVVFPHDGDQLLASRAVDAGADGYVARSAEDPFDLLASQVSRCAERGLERRRETERHRVIDVVREISQAAVRTDTREELERTICERLAGTGPYLAAVIGSVNPETGETVSRAWAGVDGVAIERIVGAGRGPTSGLQVKAVQTGEIHVREFEEGEDAALGATRGSDSEPVTVRVERAAAIPITHGERLYGVLSVYAAAKHAFDDEELGVLVDLCETTGQAIDGIETRRALERRETELVRKNERLDTFASVVSHDLRNPLEIADGYVRKARDTGDDRDFEEALTGIERAKTIVEDLLVLARSDRQIRETESVDLEMVAEQAWHHVDTGTATLDVDGTTTVAADPSQLQRLLENAFRNSVEHGSTESPTGSPSDGVTIFVGDTADGFYVADDGPGIPEDDRDDVFEPGYTTDHDGTGLGLSIIRRIVEAHGWEITVAEHETGGARFDVHTE